MLIYIDLDGVLTDLDGDLARFGGFQHSDIVKDKDLRRRVWFNLIKKKGLQTLYRELMPNRKFEMKALMRELKQRGHTVEILSSYGARYTGDYGADVHLGKRDWLQLHYGDLLSEGVISRFNGVSDCEQKKFYAHPDSLLIDDQEENIAAFIEAGGQAVRYDLLFHEASIEKVLNFLTSRMTP